MRRCSGHFSAPAGAGMRLKDTKMRTLNICISVYIYR